MNARTYRRLLAKAYGKAQKRSATKPYECLFPKCGTAAIKSHSQQRRGALTSIAENSSVYAIQRNHYQFLKQLPKSQILVPTPISRASTFDGFCSLHDRQIFSPIENVALIEGTPEQAFLMCLRSISYEYAAKRRAVDWTTFLIDELDDVADDSFLEYLAVPREGQRMFLVRDGSFYLGVLFEALEKKQFDRVRFVWKRLPKNIGVSCCCSFSPLLDSHDEYMTNHWDMPQPFVTVNIVPEASATHVVASWLEDIGQHCSWITEEIAQDDGLESFINRSAFEESEDTCVRPSLWEALTPTSRELAERAMLPQHIRGPNRAPVRLVRL